MYRPSASRLGAVTHLVIAADAEAFVVWVAEQVVAVTDGTETYCAVAVGDEG